MELHLFTNVVHTPDVDLESTVLFPSAIPSFDLTHVAAQHKISVSTNTHHVLSACELLYDDVLSSGYGRVVVVAETCAERLSPG